jgi:hypothetical protein
MVAITVIIAAMIGTFVFGVPQNIQKTKFMGTSIQVEWSQDAVLLSYHADVDFHNIPQWNHLVYQQRRVRSDTEHCIFTISHQSRFGAVMTLTPAPDWSAGQKRILVVGSYNDSQQQIISDTYI